LKKDFINLPFLKKVGKSQTTLIYWGLFEPETVFQQVIADYEKENPHVKIIYSQENLKDYQERLNYALRRQTEEKGREGEIVQRDSPDIFRIHATWTPIFGSLLSPVPSDVYDAATFEKTFYPSVKELLRYQGQYIAIPLMFDGLALYYNEDLFRTAGKTPPRSWTELKKTACEMTTRDSQGKITTAGVAMGTANNVDHWSDILALMMLQNGADLANPAACSEESGSAIESDKLCLGRDALTFYTIFASDQACSGESVNPGAVWDRFMPTSTYAFATGSLAMYFAPSWRAHEIKELNPSLNFKVIPIPQLEGNKVAWASYWAEAVSKNSKNKEEAWKFLKYLSSEEVMQKLYQTQSALRASFGEPYSRVDMAQLLKDQPYVGAYIEQASYARGWYLSSRTSDNAINDKIIKYYEDAVNEVNRGGDPLSALKTTSQGVDQVLKQYGVVR
jgi:multiple sugar transport system substrate-binding protein